MTYLRINLKTISVNLVPGLHKPCSIEHPESEAHFTRQAYMTSQNICWASAFKLTHSHAGVTNERQQFWRDISHNAKRARHKWMIQLKSNRNLTISSKMKLSLTKNKTKKGNLKNMRKSSHITDIQIQCTVARTYWMHVPKSRQALDADLVKSREQLPAGHYKLDLRRNL